MNNQYTILKKFDSLSTCDVKVIIIYTFTPILIISDSIFSSSVWSRPLGPGSL